MLFWLLFIFLLPAKIFLTFSNLPNATRAQNIKMTKALRLSSGDSKSSWIQNVVLKAELFMEWIHSGFNFNQISFTTDNVTWEDYSKWVETDPEQKAVHLFLFFCYFWWSKQDPKAWARGHPPFGFSLHLLHIRSLGSRLSFGQHPLSFHTPWNYNLWIFLGGNPGEKWRDEGKGSRGC